MNARFVMTVLLVIASGCAAAANAPPSHPAATAYSPMVAVGAQYDSTHVYVAPDDLDRLAASFLATFGGRSTKQVVGTVTPTASTTTYQLLDTPVGAVSLFGFKTPIPYPFGSERTGYLVDDIDVAVRSARACGADVIVDTFPDPIGRDAIVQWPGGTNMQLYWHFVKPSHDALARVPENRVYVSPDRVAPFVDAFLCFSHGKVVADDPSAPAADIGLSGKTFRRLRVESTFGMLAVLVTDGHVPYPYGREITGYEVHDLAETLARAKAAGVTVVVEPYSTGDRTAAMVQFPGGYVAEIHAPAH
jgi:predicted enzyme related to lactoylglutathione lyase